MALTKPCRNPKNFELALVDHNNVINAIALTLNVRDNNPHGKV